MMKFLWQGGTGSGMATVAWSDVCRPLEEGGQGVRALQPLNKGLMSKHLWDVVLHKSKSIWVIWIYQYRLKRITVWIANPNIGSWSWRKILRLRNQLIDHIRCTVGMGFTLTVWQDPWHPLVCSSTDSHGDRRLLVFHWRHNSVWSFKMVHGIGLKFVTPNTGLSQTYYPLEAADMICWNGSNDFTTREAYHLFQLPGPKVN
ncbi:UNVERIFIED_CONTAM: hypothetical protein Slati_3721600 [Sesamum latifolium]|uniref:Uncharacterized protein n=1 Tax=Sesamum latifolium TaxID=2727402 RepID=A0AAW2U3B2_9LAMI